MMKLFKIILMCIVCAAIIFPTFIIYKLSTIEVRDTKDYSQIYVKDIFDYEMMINPPEEYSALLQIDSSMRGKVAAYMKENDFKLSLGKQEFIRNNPTFEELIEDGFKFEKMEE